MNTFYDTKVPSIFQCTVRFLNLLIPGEDLSIFCSKHSHIHEQKANDTAEFARERDGDFSHQFSGLGVVVHGGHVDTIRCERVVLICAHVMLKVPTVGQNRI